MGLGITFVRMMSSNDVSDIVDKCRTESVQRARAGSIDGELLNLYRRVKLTEALRRSLGVFRVFGM